jgi:membrane-associated phospholipid phosphatase
VLLAIAVGLGITYTWDYQSVQWMQSITPRILDLPFSILSIFGAAEICIPLFLVMWYLAPARARFLLAILFALAILIPTLGKMTIYQAPLPDGWFRYVFTFGAPTSYISTAYSFPSGHVTRASFLSVLAMSLVVQSTWNKRTKQIVNTLLIAYLLSMLYSRPYLAEHWLTDAIGGTLLGVGLCFLVLDRMLVRE